MPATINLGANLPGIADWGGTNIFTNLILQSRGLSSWEDPAEIPATNLRLDANGYPLDPFGVVVKAPLRLDDDGEYQLKFRGKARAGVLPDAITLRNQRLADGWQVVDLTIPPEALSTLPGYKEPILMLRFDNLQGEAVRDISLVKKSLLRADGTAPTFHPVWIEHLRRFKVLRFMPWMASYLPMPEMNWADRPKPDRLTQAGNDNFDVEMIRGVAAEYIIELANELRCDVWINIPPLATNDYVRGLANQLKAGLPETTKVYTEYGNEIWATGAHAPATWQGNANVRLTAEEIARGNSNLNTDGTTDLDILAIRRYARRTKEIGDIFASVFGTTTRKNRIRPVYCYQSVNPAYSLQPGLDFLTSEPFGALSNSIWGISPKTGVDEGVINKPKQDVTAADLIQNMREGLGSIIGGYAHRDASPTPVLEQAAALAAYHNVAFAAYEGGIGFTDPRQAETSVVFAMMKTDWNIYDICAQYLQSWFSYGNDNLMCWFLAGATDWGGTPMFDESNIYGLTWSITDQDTLPIRALDDALARSSYEVTAGIPVPGRIDTRRHTERSANWERDLRNYRPWQPEGNLYLVNAASAKQYTIRLVSEMHPDVETSVVIWVNNRQIGAVTIPRGVGSHTSRLYSARLRQGMNALKLKYSDHAMGNYYLEVK